MTTKKSSTKTDSSCEVRISISDLSREVELEVALSKSDVLALVNSAINSGSALILDDVKGRQVIIPAAKIAFVEIGDPTARKVGFGSL
ncbi:ATP-binding protein [Actinomycetes bacterium]|nr:ATP-binding protein [Actinomycetes bacterium]